MATTTITVNRDGTKANLLEISEELISSCESYYIINVSHTIGDVLNVTLVDIIGTNPFGTNDANFSGLGIDYTSSVDNQFFVTITNSGSTGVYNGLTINLTNVTTGENDSLTLQRFNDSALC